MCSELLLVIAPMGTAVAGALHVAVSSPGRHTFPGLWLPMTLGLQAEGAGIVHHEPGPGGMHSPAAGWSMQLSLVGSEGPIAPLP